MKSRCIHFTWIGLSIALLIESDPLFAKTNSIRLNGVELSFHRNTLQKSVEKNQTNMLVLFVHPLSPKERQTLQSEGIGFERYLSSNTYLISGSVAAFNSLGKNELVAGFAPLSPEAKIDASIRVELPASAPRGSLQPMQTEMKAVKVLFQRNTPFEEAQRILQSHGAKLVASQTGFDFRETYDCVFLPWNKIISLAKEESVFLIAEVDSPTVPCNVNAQNTSNIDEIHPGGLSGYNLDGTGVTVGLWDPSGVFTTHSQLIGRATQEDGGTPHHFHATHVAGTIGASGMGNPKVQGMAPNVSILSWNSSNDAAEMDANAYRIVASNHSYAMSAGWEFNRLDNQWHWYGNPKVSPYESVLFGQYGTKSQAFDTIVYDRDLTVVVSAGNNRNQETTFWGTSYVLNDGPQISNLPRAEDGEPDEGYDTLNPIALGKNTLVVGAIHDRLIEPPTPELDSIAPWTSWGPTDDGRIKPDLVANGVKLLSLDIGNPQASRPQSGTSMASPVVVGTIACLVQQYRQRFNGADPSSSVIKSILLHTAQDEGTPPGPDYRIGWGLLDARAAADFIQNFGGNGIHLEIDSFDGSEIAIPADYIGQGPIKATLVWNDPPGNPVLAGLDDGTSTLVNDLDLSIDGPGQRHFPWTLDPSQPAHAARQDSENHRDNVEQVFIARPAEGLYTLRIGGQINMGDSQSFALCLSGLSLTERNTKLLILQPKGQRRIEGIIPLQLYAESPAGIRSLQIELDSQILDDPQTAIVEGNLLLDNPPEQLNHRFYWNTSLVPNGEHQLAMRVSDNSGEIIEKRMPLFILNKASFSPIVVDATATIGALRTTLDRDWYSFQVPDPGYYAIETLAVPNYPAPDTTLVLYGPDSQNRVIAEDDDSGLETLSKIVQFLDSNRTYYARVGYYSAGGYQILDNLYAISLRRSSPDEIQPSPVTLTANIPMAEREFLDIGDEHHYQFTPLQLATHIIDATPSDPAPSSSFQFELYKPDNPQKTIVQGYFNKPIFRVLSTGQTYRLRVTAPKSKGRYALSVSTVSEISVQNLTINGPTRIGAFVSGGMAEAWYILKTKLFSSYLMEFNTKSQALADSTAFILYGPDDPALEIVHMQTKGSFNARMFLPLRSNRTFYLQVLTQNAEGEYAIRVRTPEMVFPFLPSGTAFNPLSNSASTFNWDSWPEQSATEIEDWFQY